ncbi:isopenicillin N synthase family dioxygenase [Herbaspirillum robiniae]|uniref:2-oxoglutarate-dependent ethylene/succinate-forming enzyme n=1 Tax=Herbaspirillum robiniae TaxID=2014887 RepID=A0A246WLQ9_9BURK|nr:2-oxoglutarate and iron-dependent oxygenase domain-containing protein [Herbaspirillum robiniae]OWY27270.1 penicillin synthase [Herbaspirillum robiniae]
MIPYTPPATARTLPVIDFADAFSPEKARREAVAWEIHKISRDVGFFYIVNHGVPQALVDGQFDWARRFFALPQAGKSAIDMRRSPSGYGYERMGAQALDEGSPADLKEGFQFGFDIAPDHPYVQRGLLRYGHNLWPAELPGFEAHSRRYYDALRALSHRLLSVIALSLQLEEDFFEPVLQTPIATQRMLHYPPQPQGAQDNRIGAGAHTDWGLVTLLAQDDIGGLEVRNADGEWIRAAPIRGSFVVNIGDLLQRWSNDLYHSNFHRVLNGGTAPRYSLPFFQDGDQACTVACLPGCCSAARPARYAPCTIGDYLDMKVRETFGAASAPA